jgi:hypothetical protein
VELLTALPAAPSAADVVYASLQAYPDSDGFTDYGGTTRTLRFVCSSLDTGAQWHLLGCQLEGLTFNLTHGAVPTITWRYRAAYWDRVADTTPSAVTLQNDLAAPVMAGSVFFQTVGTTTRSTIDVESTSLSVNLGLVPMNTLEGDATYQTINGWVRTSCTAEATFRLHTWASTYQTLWDADGSTAVQKHILWQGNTTDGRSVGFYMPRSYIVGNRPSYEEVGGLTGVSFTMRAREGATVTNDLTRSPIRFWFA